MQDVSRLTTADRDLAAEKYRPTSEFGGFTLAFEQRSGEVDVKP